jgi:ADP-ribosyl-[dinitrogen reductase] hydrolase
VTPAATDGADAAVDVLRDRYRGLLLGLALGDALGAAAQHRRPGTFTRIGDLLGGGPYDLPRGAWTDDAAVPLLLADSLVDSGGFERADADRRLGAWQAAGTGSATGQCLGISATLARSLAARAADPHALVDATRTDREPLPRAAIAAAFELADPERAVALAADLARLTHTAPLVVDACRYAAALAVGVLTGVPKAELLAPDWAPVAGLWRREPLHRQVAAVAAGEWREPAATAATASGDAAAALRLLLAALASGTGYRDTVLATVNLGLDADANGALVGQFAGALAGAAALPAHWLADLADAPRIGATADRLLASALGRIVVT